MTDVKSLILTIVYPLLNHPDSVQIDVQESHSYIEYTLKVESEDMGRIIGKQGRVVQAIRTVVYSARTSHGKKVRLNISELNA